MVGIRVGLSVLWVALAVMLMGQAGNCPLDMQKINDLIGGGGSKPNAKIYIANLSFMDADTRSVMAPGDADLINDAVLAGMQALSQADQRYVVNDPKNTVANNDINSQKLSDVFWNAQLSRTEKVDKIVNELMAPNNVDGLVFGQFNQKQDGSIIVRPIVIARSSKNMMTETRTFSKPEFECKDPNNANKKVLCDKAKEDIKDTVIKLLKNI